MRARRAFRSAFRGSRASNRVPSPPSVKYPAKGRRVGRGKAHHQAMALSDRYKAGGFDAMKQSPGWYDLPEWRRKQLMEETRNGG